MNKVRLRHAKTLPSAWEQLGNCPEIISVRSTAFTRNLTLIFPLKGDAANDLNRDVVLEQFRRKLLRSQDEPVRGAQTHFPPYRHFPQGNAS